MTLNELTQKIKIAGQTRTREQRMKLLRDARILDSHGRFDPKFFSSIPEDRSTSTVTKA